MKKKIIIVTGLLNISFLASAQVQLIYNPDALKQYTGTWQWINQKDTFTLTLISDTLRGDNKNNNSNQAKQKKGIYAWHKFVEGGKVIENTLPFVGNIKKSSGVGTVALSLSTIYLGMGFTDSVRQRTLRVFFKIINQQGTQAVWESWLQERPMYPSPNPIIWEGRTIPSPITLTKIKD